MHHLLVTVSVATHHVLSRIVSGAGYAGRGVYNGRRKVATGAAALLAVMVGYHVVFGQNGLTAYRAKRHEIRDLQSQTIELQRDNEHLRSHVDRLGTDPNAIEHEARESLHYTRPGEVIYTMPLDRGESR